MLSLSIRGVDEGRDMQRPPSMPDFLSTHKTEEEVGSGGEFSHRSSECCFKGVAVKSEVLEVIPTQGRKIHRLFCESHETCLVC